MLTLSRETAEPQSTARMGLRSLPVGATPSFDRCIRWQASTHDGLSLQLDGEAWDDGHGISVTLAQSGRQGTGRRHQAYLHLRSVEGRQRSWPLGDEPDASVPGLTLVLTLSEVPNSRRVNLWATCMLSADEAVHQVIGQWQREPEAS